MEIFVINILWVYLIFVLTGRDKIPINVPLSTSLEI